MRRPTRLEVAVAGTLALGLGARLMRPSGAETSTVASTAPKEPKRLTKIIETPKLNLARPAQVAPEAEPAEPSEKYKYSLRMIRENIFSAAENNSEQAKTHTRDLINLVNRAYRLGKEAGVTDKKIDEDLGEFVTELRVNFGKEVAANIKAKQYRK